jgi:hypothetical protein
MITITASYVADVKRHEKKANHDAFWWAFAKTAEYTAVMCAMAHVSMPARDSEIAAEARKILWLL